jgi:alpha-D-ribose 1-methylphosphonate 5-triphosphate synthase subunit PhnH
MPAPRLYKSHAERQRAYRERLKAAARPGGGSVTAKPGKVDGRALRRRAEALLQALQDEMEVYMDARSEAWREAERGEAFQEAIDLVEAARLAVGDIA